MSKLSKNIIYNLIGQCLILILGFVAVKYIYDDLGEDALGIIYFTAMVNGLLCTILEMGICSTTVREVSAYFKSEKDYIKNLIRTFSLLYWIIFILLAFGIYSAASFLVLRWINLSEMDSATATYALRILGISSFVALPKSLYASLFKGLQRMEFNNLIDVTTLGLQQFGIIIILYSGGGLFQVIFMFSACYWLSLITYMILTAHFFTPGSLVPSYSSHVIKRISGFTSRMSAISIMATIHTHADKLIISKLLPIGLVGYYGFAYGTISKGMIFIYAVSQAAFPSLSDLYKNKEQFTLNSKYQKLQELICYGSVLIFAGIVFAALPLFSLFLILKLQIFCCYPLYCCLSAFT